MKKSLITSIAILATVGLMTSCANKNESATTTASTTETAATTKKTTTKKDTTKKDTTKKETTTKKEKASPTPSPTP